MLVTHRRIALLGSEANRGYTGLVADGARVYVATGRGIINENARPNGPKPGWRAHLQIVISGRLILQRDRSVADLGPGDWLMERCIADERWEGDDFAALVFEWEDGLGPDPPEELRTGALTGWQRSRATELVRRLTEARPTMRAEATELARDLASVVGIDLSLECPSWTPQLQTFANVAGEVLSRLDRQPMWCDLERATGLSERTLRRWWREYTALCGVAPNGASFRTYLRSLRLNHAVSFVTAAEASVEQIAMSLGYGSGRALGTALRQSKLPSPTELRRRILSGA